MDTPCLDRWIFKENVTKPTTQFMLKITALLLILGMSISTGCFSSWAAADAVDSSGITLAGAKTFENIIDGLDFDETNVADAIDTIAQHMDGKVDVSPGVTGQISLHMKNVPAFDALRILLEMKSLAYSQEGDTVSVMNLQEFEKARGQKFEPEIQVKIQPLSYVDSQEMVTDLQEMKSPQGRIYALQNPDAVVLLDTQAHIQELTKSLKEMDVRRFRMVFELTYAKAAQLSERIKPLLTKDIGRIKTDEESNKIIVTDTAVKIEEIHKMVDEFDHRDRKVQIDAKIVDIALNDEHHSGIDWEAIVSNYQSLDMKSQPESSGGTKKRKLSVGLIANDDYSILIEALDTVGKVDILPERNIATVNNKEARILVGPLPSDGPAESQLSRKQQEVQQEFDLQRLGMKLFVTPTVHPDGDTTLKIRAEISSVAAPTSESSKPVEEISQAQMTLRIKKGVTVVIGGLVQEERSSVTKKVPVLGDVPLLGSVFRSSTYDTHEMESVVFITPKISEADIGTPVQAKK